MKFRTWGAAVAVALSALACQPETEPPVQLPDPAAPEAANVRPGLSISAGHGALSSSAHRLVLQVGGGPAGATAAPGHTFTAGR